MAHSGTNPFHLLSGLDCFSRLQDNCEEIEALAVGELPVLPLFHNPSSSNEPEAMRLSISDHKVIVAPHKHYASAAQELLQSLLPSYPVLNPRDIIRTGEHPIAAGGYADVWKATHNGHNVALKLYRCYMQSFDVTRVVARFRNEVKACSLLPADALLVGFYSTERDPFGLVYRYMDNLDLKQFLNNEPNVERLNLLRALAQCLNHMHDLGIVHGNLRTTNILVDNHGIPHIAGLGNARILPRSTPGTMEGKIRTDLISGDRLQDIGQSETSQGSDDIPTKAGDMYSFRVMAYEVLTGEPTFRGATNIATTYLLLKGIRPPQSNYRKVSNVVWKTVKGCWNPAAPRRMAIEEMVTLLEAEYKSCHHRNLKAFLG